MSITQTRPHSCFLTSNQGAETLNDFLNVSDSLIPGPLIPSKVLGIFLLILFVVDAGGLPCFFVIGGVYA